jgi:predicted Zn-dependent protease with MMP-like domain
MDEATFRLHVNKAFDAIPLEFKKDLKNVEITIEDEPSDDQRSVLKLRRNSLLFGLFSGVPQTVPGEERATLPDRITIFRLPILAAYHTEEDIIKQIKSTLYHEIGHYFGIDEARLRKLQRS